MANLIHKPEIEIYIVIRHPNVKQAAVISSRITAPNMDKGTLLGHCTQYPDLKQFGSDDFLRIKHTAGHRFRRFFSLCYNY